MEVMYDLVVDFARVNKSNTIMISENDRNSRLLHFTLLNNKQPMSMSDVVGNMVKILKPNGDTVTGIADFVYDDNGIMKNELNYLIPETVTFTAGTMGMTVTLIGENNTILTSFEMYLNVRDALYSEEDYLKGQDYVDIRDMLEKAFDTIKKLDDMEKDNKYPNPMPLVLEIEDDTTSYDGREDAGEVVVTLKDMAYLADNPVIEVDQLDETATHIASKAATDAREAADEAITAANNANRDATAALEAKVIATKAASDSADSEEFSKVNAYIAEGWAKGTKNGEPVSPDSPYYQNNAEYFANKVSVVDNLYSVETKQPLSANQGRILNDIKLDKDAIGDWAKTKEKPVYAASEILAPTVIAPNFTQEDFNNEIKGELQSIPFIYVGYEAFESLADRVEDTEENVSKVTQDLTQDLNYYEQSGFLPKNLFNWNDLVVGKKFQSTTIVNDTNWGIAYIPYKIGEPISISGYANYGLSGGIGFADENKNIIEVAQTTSVSGTYSTSNSNAKYFCASVVTNTSLTAYRHDMQIEYGSTTPYTPYAPSNFEISRIRQDLTQFKEEGYLPNNVWDGNWAYGFEDASETSTSNYYRKIVVHMKSGKHTVSELNGSSEFLKVIRVYNRTTRANIVGSNGVTQITNKPLEFTINADADIVISFGRASTDGGGSLQTQFTDAEWNAFDILVEDGEHVPSNSSLKQSLAQLVADSMPQNLSLTTESNVKQTYRLRAKKIGKEIVLNIYGALNAITSDLTSWKPLFQMPQGMTTSNHIDFALCLGGAPYMVQAMVTNTGTIQFLPKQSLNDGTLFFINLVYVLD